MSTKITPLKVTCCNPNTGGSVNIDQQVYDLFSKAIFHTLKTSEPLSYTQIVEGIYQCFREGKTKFDGSVEWYAVTVKHDMQAKGIIEVFTHKGKKLHRLSK